MTAVLPLSTLLSQALVAFTVEVDYEFEQRMPHFTTYARKAGQPARGPWLISLPFWSMCLRHVADGGTAVGEVLERGFLEDKFLLGTNPGMVRWGYLRLEPGDSPAKRPNRSWTVLPTAAGRQAQQVCAPLPELVESRWLERWRTVRQLRRTLEEMVAGFDQALPDHVPVNGSYQSRVSIPTRPPDPASGTELSALLAKALVRFTIEVEAASPLPMVHAANVARALMDGPVARRRLPHLTGVAKETLAVMVGIMEKTKTAAALPDNSVGLTARGRDAAASTYTEVAKVERQWGAEGLRRALEPIVGDGTMEGSPLRLAVDPPEGTWRHGRALPATLPHHPVVSHRGGYPDGS